MNFQPPKPAQRRTYIDGISIVKSSVIPLQPVMRMGVTAAREPILAHRAIHVSNTNRLGLPMSRVGNSSLAKMHKLVSVRYTAFFSGGSNTLLELKRHALLAVARIRSVVVAVVGKNWHAFVPARYKKYSASHGVTVNRAFKSQSATIAFAALVLLTFGLWPGTANTSTTGPIASSNTSVTSKPSTAVKDTTTTTPAVDTRATSAETITDVSGGQALWQTTTVAKQDELPVTDVAAVTPPADTGTTTPPSDDGATTPNEGSTTPQPEQPAPSTPESPPAGEGTTGTDGEQSVDGSGSPETSVESPEPGVGG